MTIPRHPVDDLLWTLSGKSGENLATAYLKWLIDQHNGLSDLLIQRLLEPLNYNNRSRTKTPSITYLEFSTCETDTSEQTINSGRIDLLIKTGTHTIGIESKLHAGFQSDQPAKYLNAVKEESIKDGATSLPVFVILCPIRRKIEITEIANTHNSEHLPVHVVEWEKLLTEDEVDEELRLSLRALREFYERCCNPFRWLSMQMAFDRNDEKNSKIGDPQQQAGFLRAVTSLLSEIEGINPAPQVEHSPNYYYFQSILYSGKGAAAEVAGGLGFVNVDFYHFPDHIKNANACKRVLVLCIAKEFKRKSNEPIDGLIQIELRDKPARKGIVRHAEKDGEIWVVSEDEWSNYPNNPKYYEGKWSKRLRQAFGH